MMLWSQSCYCIIPLKELFVDKFSSFLFSGFPKLSSTRIPGFMLFNNSLFITQCEIYGAGDQTLVKYIQRQQIVFRTWPFLCLCNIYCMIKYYSTIISEKYSDDNEIYKNYRHALWYSIYQSFNMYCTLRKILHIYYILNFQTLIP